MTAYNVVNRTLMQAGLADDISEVVANFDAIAAVLNGGLDGVNLKGTPALASGEAPVWNGSSWIRGLQHGQPVITTVNGWKTTPVVFTAPYTTGPTVVVSLGDAAQVGMVVRAQIITTVGFDLEVYHTSVATIRVHWIAFGI